MPSSPSASNSCETAPKCGSRPLPLSTLAGDRVFTACPISRGSTDKVTECLPFNVFPKNCAADFAPQASYLANTHGAEHLDQLGMPGAHQVHDALRGVFRIERLWID